MTAQDRPLVEATWLVLIAVSKMPFAEDSSLVAAKSADVTCDIRIPGVDLGCQSVDKIEMVVDASEDCGAGGCADCVESETEASLEICCLLT